MQFTQIKPQHNLEIYLLIFESPLSKILLAAKCLSNSLDVQLLYPANVDRTGEMLRWREIKGRISFSDVPFFIVIKGVSWKVLMTSTSRPRNVSFLK